MKKKICIALLALTATGCCAVGASACDLFGGNTESKHTHSYTQSTVDPTCTEQGYILYSCECGDSYKDTYTDALGHDPVHHEGKPASCDEDGWEAYDTCTRCDYSDKVIIPASHNFVDGICTVCGQVEPSNGLAYALRNGTYAVSGIGTCTDSDIIIADYYNKLPVTEIMDGAFNGYNGLTGVTFGKNITRIGNQAFYRTGISGQLVLPDGLTEIGNNAFTDCSGLTGELIIPDGVTELNEQAFSNCSGLESLVIGRNVEKIGAFCFDGCTGLKCDLIIPDSVKQIKQWAFQMCSGLTGLTLGSQVEEIGDRAFYNCSGMESQLKLPDCLKIIGEDAFSICSGLTGELKLPSGLTVLGGSAFLHCSGLTGTLTVPEGITVIERYTFGYCSGFTGLVIPETVTAVKEYGFCGLTGLSCELKLPAGLVSIAPCAFESCGFTGELVIPDTVLELGRSAFGGCAGLTGVKLPDTLAAIPEGLFYNCTGLKGKIELPSTVASIGNSAFYACTGLTEINIPEVVTSIGDCAFESCTGLSGGLVIPDSVTEIGEYAFGSTNLKKITVGRNVQTIGRKAFGIYGLIEINNLSGVTLQFTEDGDEGVVSNSVWNIYTPDSGRQRLFEKDGFSFYEGDEEVLLVWYPATVKELVLPDYFNEQSYAVYDALFANNESITSVVFGKGVTGIGSYAFSGCSNLKTVKINENLEKIDSYALSNCKNLEEIYYNAKNCSDLAGWGSNFISDSGNSGGGINIVIGSSVRYIPANLFNLSSGVTLVKSVEFEDNSRCTEIGVRAFAGLDITAIIIPDSVAKIGEFAFSENYHLVSVTLGANVNEIGSGAFYNCKKLVEIYNFSDLPIENGVIDNSYINQYCFDIYVTEEQSKLNTDDSDFIFYEDGETVYLMGYTGTSTDLTLPEKYKGKNYAVYNYAFYNNYTQANNIISLSVPASVTDIGEKAFYGLGNLESITVAAGNKNYSSEGNCLVDKRNGKLILGCVNSVIPDGVKSIGEYAFYMCNGLKEIVIPDSVTEISEGAFDSCRELEKLTFGNNLRTIGMVAFRMCESLTSIDFPDSVTEIGNNAFFYCRNLTEVNFGKNLKHICGSAFYCCNLKEIVIPEGVTEIDNYAFSECTLLEYVSLPDSLTTLTQSVFNYCNNLEFNIYNGVKYLGNAANPYLVLYGVQDKSLTEHTVHSKTKIIVDRAFYECTELTQVILPDGLTVIGVQAFAYCSNLGGIEIPEGVTSISSGLFNECSNLVRVTLPDGLQSIASSAFNNCVKLKEITVPDSVTYIDSAFYNCISLEKISLPFIGYDGEQNAWSYLGYIFGASYAGGNAEYVPQSLKSVTVTGGSKIFNSAFYLCENITEIILPDTVTVIEDNAFSGCSSLVDIVLKNGIEEIGNRAFENCSSLESITIPNGVKQIRYGSFSHCSSLTEIHIPASVTYIENNAFEYCSAIQKITVSAENPVYYSQDNCLIYFNNEYGDNSRVLVFGCANSIIPDDITEIGYGAFMGCTDLKSIVIPESVSLIRAYAFYESGLERVELNHGISMIDGNAFEMCENIKVYYTGTEDDWQYVYVYEPATWNDGNSVYFYSETEPVEDGNFWRYVDGKVVEW